jgi:hypothetical protein
MARLRKLAPLLLPACALLPAGLARAHQGPPFPLLEDRRVGPFVASVWTDPDIGNGTFYVILDAPEGRRLPAATQVRVGVVPASGPPAEAVCPGVSQPAHAGARYVAIVPFPHGGMWRVRVFLDSAQGGGILTSSVEATPDGTIGPIGLAVYLMPFLAVGFLWLKATLRRRELARATVQTAASPTRRSASPRDRGGECS